eukprot:TRINITY_DN28904_c0_g1_i1.p1 TRINITY_DN28904_c0_g1~~TRINITY_DN28904_c0_g1_i1.p1  ORF type:complete len:534 (-),score=112.09 TRINITY_DN28904_c0_g1_i1:86-1687(-)
MAEEPIAKRRKASPCEELESVRVLSNIESSLLVIEKPPSVYLDRSNSNKDRPPQPGVTIYEQLRTQFPEDRFPYLTHCHQLDFPTSGLLLFALSKKTASEISSGFASRKISKTYRAIVPNPRFHVSQGEDDAKFQEARERVWKLLEDGHEVLIQFRLGTDPSDPNGFKQVAFTDHLSGREAVTRVRLISAGKLKTGKESEAVWLVELYPVTGRTHQLRVHLLSIGLAIVGDATYSSRTISDRLMLHAYRLKFPFQGKTYDLETPVDPLEGYIGESMLVPSVKSDPRARMIWLRRKYACALPFVQVKDPEKDNIQHYFLLARLPKKRKDFSKKKGFWWGFFWKELSSSECDVAEGASSAFDLNTLFHFRNGDFPLVRSSFIRKGSQVQFCAISESDSISGEYPQMMIPQSILFVIPLTETGCLTTEEFSKVKEKISQVNEALVTNEGKTGKDSARVGGISSREVGFYTTEEVFDASRMKTGLILDEWLEVYLKNDQFQSAVSSTFESIPVQSHEPEEYGLSYFETNFSKSLVLI